jgi:hypothetical protein
MNRSARRVTRWLIRLSGKASSFVAADKTAFRHCCSNRGDSDESSPLVVRQIIRSQGHGRLAFCIIKTCVIGP